MERLDDKTKETKKNSKYYLRTPVPDWDKRVESDIATAMISYSPGNGQSCEDLY